MTAPLQRSSERAFRVLLAGQPGAASSALAGWVSDQTRALVAGPATTTAAAAALAVIFEPHVVLLDFHGRADSTADAVLLFKQLSSSPLVIVLTHDGSESMRRRCRSAGVDAVFDKTRELEALAGMLEKTRQSLTELPAVAFSSPAKTISPVSLRPFYSNFSEETQS